MPLATRPGDRRQVVANTVPDPGLAVSGSTAAAAGVTHAPAGKTAEWTRTPSFRLVLPSRKSPNLSNSRACVAAHSLFLLRNILVECIRHNHGSKSAIQSPENFPEEPSRLRLDGGSSASRSSRSTPSGELENSSTTRPWYPARSMRRRFRIWMVLKLKTNSSRLPVHVIEVSVRPSSNKSVVPSPSTPTQATPKSIESGLRNVSDTKGNETTPALKSTAAVEAPSLVLLMNSST